MLARLSKPFLMTFLRIARPSEVSPNHTNFQPPQFLLPSKCALTFSVSRVFNLRSSAFSESIFNPVQTQQWMTAHRHVHLAPISVNQVFDYITMREDANRIYWLIMLWAVLIPPCVFMHNLSRLRQANKIKVLMLPALCWISAMSSVKPKSSNLNHSFHLISTGILRFLPLHLVMRGSWICSLTLSEFFLVPAIFCSLVLYLLTAYTLPLVLLSFSQCSDDCYLICWAKKFSHNSKKNFTARDSPQNSNLELLNIFNLTYLIFPRYTRIHQLLSASFRLNPRIDTHFHTL